MARRLIAQPVKRIKQAFKFSDFAAVGAVGTADFPANTLPAGCIVLGVEAHVDIAFVGDTTGTIQVGVPGALAKFTAILTKSLYAIGHVNMAAPPLTSDNDALATPRVTITGTLAYSGVTAGHMTVTVYYMDTRAKSI